MAIPEDIYTDRIHGKIAIYLDTNAWSDLSEAATDDSRAARDLVLDAHARGRIVCPLAFPTITELLKRDVNADSAAQATLMDLLSDGVSFCGPRQVRDVEIQAGYSFMLHGERRSPLAHVFTITVCYEANQRIAFPEGWTEPAADEFMAGLQQSGFPGVRWLQAHRRSQEYLELHATTDQKYVREISRKRNEASEWASDRSGKLLTEKLRVEEHTCVLNKCIIENVLRLADAQTVRRLVPHLLKLQSDTMALRRVVEAMPSTWLSCEMNVQRVLSSTRRTRKQDFYDHEHAVLAVPYADAFVTSDGGILDVLRRARASDRFSCRLVRGMSGLSDYLVERSAA